MKKTSFNTSINAKAEKVWKTLWDDKTYREWTAIFSPDSHAISDWQEGSRIEFVDGKGSGMYGFIDKKINNRQMTFHHMGELKDGVEKQGEWAGALESYTLTENNGATELKVEMDVNEEMEKYFVDTFPKALEEVKRIAEKEG